MACNKRVLITGSRGRLGQELMEKFPSKWNVCGIGREEADITDYKAVSIVISDFSPDIVIHTAGYTDVDKAESEPEEAMRVNGLGTENIARACQESDSKLIYISSDFVFDGTKSVPYIEDDTPNPQTAYGKNKLAGEKAVESLVSNCLIVRIGWVYGRHGKSFVSTMIEKGQQQIESRQTSRIVPPIRVVDDQFGSPTSEWAIANRLFELAERDVWGIVHIASRGEVNRFDFTKEIFGLLGMDIELQACSSEDYPLPATRPARSSLESRRLDELGIGPMPTWKQDIEMFFKSCARYAK
ncbi:MAG: dTDP-4-dehydrorhamnose reductase [candidate division Zixibacteria bacterium]|mgnify:CR=1 FL=1|nr:dTDP-4-dehydrorhamnose reductase [candidate division Zixibacteria bacterium]